VSEQNENIEAIVDDEDRIDDDLGDAKLTPDKVEFGGSNP